MSDKIDYCSFCEKAHFEVRALVEGPAEANICDRCVLVAVSELLKEKEEEK